ncbi:MAG: DNA polymerase III subunit epsilon [Alphaproteobacteria bacterium]|nr:DNA polymerase III subunit epsilon [Alphaproteobacteria bacterium]
MREIVLDTETTGLDPVAGDRIVDIGCVELVNHMPTGRVYQQYINPEKKQSAEVIAVHGLTDEFLADKPTFKEIADDFLNFIGDDSVLVIHNAPFDMKFLNAELSWCDRPCIPMDRAFDTLLMARQKFPGSRVNLNDLCKRFGVDNSARTVHGALLDSQLLAEVYLEMLGGKEPSLVLKTDQPIEKIEKKVVVQNVSRETLTARAFEISTEELAAHTEFVKNIKSNIWGISS